MKRTNHPVSLHKCPHLTTRTPLKTYRTLSRLQKMPSWLRAHPSRRKPSSQFFPSQIVFACFTTSYKRKHTVRSLFCLASLTQHSCSEVCPRCCGHQVLPFLLLSSTPLYAWTSSLIPSFIDRLLGCCQFGAIIKLLLTFLYKSFCGHTFLFSGINIQKWNC